MDLNLSLTFQQQNDNKAIILTDTTDNWDSNTGTNLVAGDEMVPYDFYEIVVRDPAGVDFAGGIGAPDNNPGTRFVGIGNTTLLLTDELKVVTPTIAEIDAATLDSTITGVDEVGTAKNQIDLLTQFGPFVTQDDLVYTVTALLLGDSADSELIDGLYQLTYTIKYSGNGTVNTKTDTLIITILVYGQVKVATYDKIRKISTLYMCTNGCPSSEINEADLCGAYLSGVENSAFTAKTEELLDMLVVLTSMINNGSKITW